MCKNFGSESDFWDATNSWSGYNYQGKMALYVALKKLNELVGNNNFEEIEKYYLELEWLEDFSIMYDDGQGAVYKTIHQVKAKDTQKIDIYEDALVKLYHKVTHNSSIENAYLHICKSIANNNTSLDSKIREMVLRCNQIKETQNKIIEYRNNDKKDEEIKKIYGPSRKSKINNLIKDYNKRFFENKRIKVDNVDEILDKIYSDLQEQIDTCEAGIKEESLAKIQLYKYSNGNEYCELELIEELISHEINCYWGYVDTEGWKRSDSNFCKIIYLCLQGMIDQHITQRHINYSSTDKCNRRISFCEIKKILDSDKSIERNELYYISKIKQKLLSLCEDYHIYCNEVREFDEQREECCNRCDVFSFAEKVTELSLEEIKDLVHVINPDILKEINEIDWAAYCSDERYKNHYFEFLRDVKEIFDKEMKYVSYKGKDGKWNLLTTLSNHRSDKNSVKLICRDIVNNPYIYEIFMDYGCLISENIDADSIYRSAGDYLKDSKLEENHIYHCNNTKIRTVESVTKEIEEGTKNG